MYCFTVALYPPYFLGSTVELSPQFDGQSSCQLFQYRRCVPPSLFLSRRFFSSSVSGLYILFKSLQMGLQRFYFPIEYLGLRFPISTGRENTMVLGPLDEPDGYRQQMENCDPRQGAHRKEGRLQAACSDFPMCTRIRCLTKPRSNGITPSRMR